MKATAQQKRIMGMVLACLDVAKAMDLPEDEYLVALGVAKALSHASRPGGNLDESVPSELASVRLNALLLREIALAELEER